ncbi:hypothetical protein Btru_072788 [Bulinus truncatus]|nr:hypothetical protein Btru_072788 [Bulinus truncatus]
MCLHDQQKIESGDAVGSQGASGDVVGSQGASGDAVGSQVKEGTYLVPVVKEVFEPFGLSLKDLGGLNSKIAELKCRIFNAQEPYCASRCISLHGLPGTGKSHLVTALTLDLGLPTFHLDHFWFQNEKDLVKIFQKAQDRSPSIVVIDNIGSMFPKQHPLTETLTIIIDMFKTPVKPGYVVIIGVTNCKYDLDPMLTRIGRFSTEVEIDVPSVKERLQIMKVLLKKWQHGLDEQLLETFARRSVGYVGADLAASINEAITSAKRRNPDEDSKITVSEMDIAFTYCGPSALGVIHVEESQVSWSDVCGMSEIKKKIKQTIEALINPTVFF